MAAESRQMPAGYCCGKWKNAFVSCDRSWGASSIISSAEASEFTAEQLLRLRVIGIALGYEDLNDHEQLRHDLLLALMCGRKNITEQDRVVDGSRGVPLAGKSTLNYVDLTPVGETKAN